MSPVTDFHVAVFEAIPSPVFILDRELCIIDFNEAAVRMADPVFFEMLRPQAAEITGCAHPSCRETMDTRRGALRSSAGEALESGRVCRRMTRMLVRKHGRLMEADFLITAAPFQDGSEPLVLIILENINEVIALEGKSHPETRTQPSACVT